jgi:hypothetical protein
MGVPSTNDWTKVLGWPGCRVFQQEIDEINKNPQALSAA